MNDEPRYLIKVTDWSGQVYWQGTFFLTYLRANAHPHKKEELNKVMQQLKTAKSRHVINIIEMGIRGLVK